MQAIETCIPTKCISNNTTSPWITPDINANDEEATSL